MSAYPCAFCQGLAPTRWYESLAVRICERCIPVTTRLGG